MARLLADEAGQLGRNDYPSERWIRREQAEFRQAAEEARRPYREFHWPETFERADLPWEAQPAALELMRVWSRGPRLEMVSPDARRRLSPAARPSVRLVRWFWRITQAAPDASAFERRHIAGWLAAAEAAGSDVRRAVEGWLWYAPWRSEEALATYEKALAEGSAPRFEFTAREGTQVQADALLELVGGHGFGGGRWVNDKTGESGELTEGEVAKRLFGEEL
jgi:hypothetical protein